MSSGPTAYDVAHHYDEAYYADLAERYTRRTRFARTRIRNVLSLLPPIGGRTVVDLGCGMGTFTLESARLGAVAVGVDPAPAALEAARRVAALRQTRSVLFVRADAADLPLAARSADVVLAADLVEHLDDATLRRVLGEAARVLKTEGVLVLYTPDRGHLFEVLRRVGILRDGDPSHIGLRSAGELAAVVEEAGFEVVSVRSLPSHLPGWSLVERAFAPWLPALRRRIGLVGRVEGS